MASQNRDSMRLKQYNGLPTNRYRNVLESNVLVPIIRIQNDRLNINLKLLRDTKFEGKQMDITSFRRRFTLDFGI